MLVSQLPLRDAYLKCSSGTTVDKLAKLFVEQRGYTTSVILASDGKLMGVISIYDIIAKVVAANLLPSNIRVDDIMERAIFVSTNDEVEKVLDLMKRTGFTVLPVVDEQGRYVGAVMLADIARVAQQARNNETSAS